MAFYLNVRGYQVLEAANGRAAIQSAITGKPNLILLDFRLPDINGVDLAEELGKLPQIKNIPIVGWIRFWIKRISRYTTAGGHR